MSKLAEKKLEVYVTKYKKSLSVCMKNENFNSVEYMFYDSKFNVSGYFEELNNVNTPKEKKYILRVNFALSCMDVRSAKLLWKEYFFNIEKFWWMRLYTRSTFYRLRKKAIDEFLCYME